MKDQEYSIEFITSTLKLIHETDPNRTLIYHNYLKSIGKIECPSCHIKL
jgi:hypothetical protein